MPLPPLGEHELLVFWCQLAVLLVAARVGGYVARRLGQPRVIGELLAGVALGPTLAAQIFPDAWEWLFPDDSRQSGLLLGLAWFGIVLLLMTTGAEADLAMIRRQGPAAFSTAVGSLVLPLAAGVALGLALPDGFLGEDGRRWVFAVFFGIALAISSLPVAARILGDMGLLTQPLGQLVLTVAMTNDIVGWILLGVLAGVAETGEISMGDLVIAVVGMALVAAVVLGTGARLLGAALRLVDRGSGGPGAPVSLAVLFTLLVGAATHALGLEVVIGAFLAGIAIGQSPLASDPLFRNLDVLTNSIFAPLFFAVAGLRVDLRALDETSVILGAILVTVVASAAKLAGAYWGARVGGLDRSEAFGAGAALNARGALEIVVATVGLTLGVLNDASYSAIVLMAIATSAAAGPLLRLRVRR